MPAAKSPASPARVAANRANAQKSTGPRTPEGKARSRANAIKHGLTGAGVALPGEDAARIEEEFLVVQEDLAPQTHLGMTLARRLALLTLRKDRAAATEAALLRVRSRHAAAQFDAARAARADQLVDAIEASPRACRRALLTMPEGVDRLIEQLDMLVDDLTGPTATWGQAHHRRADALFGFRPGDLPIHRPTRFSRALLGDFAAIGAEEIAAVPPEDHAGWALLQLADAIDAEVDRLRAHRATLDHDTIAADRADAVAAAGFDPGPDAAKAHRYEQAAARELSRTLVDFRRAEALGTAEPPPTDAATATAAIEAPATETPAAASTADDKSCRGNEIGAGLASFGEPGVAAPGAVGSASNPASASAPRPVIVPVPVPTSPAPHG